MMNRIVSILFLTLSLPCYLFSGDMASQHRPADPTQQVSVHDMFKDISEDEIVQLMEEGQREMERIMTESSPAEQEAFMKMMEETLQNFSEDDFAEIEKIVQVVEPRLSEKLGEEPVKQAAVKTDSVKKAQPKVIMSSDSTFENVLKSINKIVNSILLKAKSDHNLHDILSKWIKKDEFNEMIRLLQALNTKELIIKLTSSDKDDVNKLVLTIENFNKRLELENKQFTVADTFGLEVDAKTSAENTIKLNIILDFFANATETLLPMITKFFQEYEPEALKLAQAHDQQAKESLDAAMKIEKMKRPIGGYTPTGNAPSYGNNRNNYDQRDHGQRGGGYGQQNNYNQANRNYGSSPQDRRARNKMGSNEGQTPSMPSASPQNTVQKPEDKTNSEKQRDQFIADKKQKDDEANKKAAPLKKSIRNLDRYNDMVDPNSFQDYVTILNQTDKVFKEFDEALRKLPNGIPYYLKPGFNGPLNPEQAKQKQDLANTDQKHHKAISQREQLQPLYKDNTKSARTNFIELKPVFNNIKPHLTEMKDAIDATRQSLQELNIQDLQNLKSSPALNNIKTQFNKYEKSFNDTLHKLKDIHKMYKIESENNAEYDKLELDIADMHGLSKLIDDTKHAISSLERNIQAEIKQRQREKRQN